MTEAIRTTSRVLWCVSAIVVATSCSRDDAAKVNKDAAPHVVAAVNAAPSGVAEVACVAEQGIESHATTPAERYEAEFMKVLAINDVNHKAGLDVVKSLCDEICKLPQGEALPLLEHFLDVMIVAAPSPVRDSPVKQARMRYAEREAWFERMLYSARCVFYASLKMQDDPFEDWSKLFEIFKKCRDEVESTLKSLPEMSLSRMGMSDRAKGFYVCGLVDDLNKCASMMESRFDYYQQLFGREPTEEQRAAIMRGFEEIEKHAVIPPYLREDGGK